MPRRNEEFAAQLAPIIAEHLADKLIDQLRSDLLVGEDRVLTEAEAGRVLTASGRTLEHWRGRGIGPRCVKVGARKIGYRVGELRAYIREAERGPPRRQSGARRSTP